MPPPTSMPTRTLCNTRPVATPITIENVMNAITRPIDLDPSRLRRHRGHDLYALLQHRPRSIAQGIRLALQGCGILEEMSDQNVDLVVAAYEWGNRERRAPLLAEQP